MRELRRVCVRLFATADSGSVEAELVSVFHSWIRQRRFSAVFIDVADYTHVPEGPGVALVTHDITFALDRADGRLNLHAQRRRPASGNAADAIEATLRAALQVADLLEHEPALSGRLRFDRTSLRVEANDRLRAPNSADAFGQLHPLVHAAISKVMPGASLSVNRVQSDRRSRLAADISIGTV